MRQKKNTDTLSPNLQNAEKTKIKTKTKKKKKKMLENSKTIMQNVRNVSIKK